MGNQLRELAAAGQSVWLDNIKRSMFASGELQKLLDVGLRGMTVNTCTADHPRALPNYKAAGFVEVRRVREVWDIPKRLGLDVPARLKV